MEKLLNAKALLRLVSSTCTTIYQFQSIINREKHTFFLLFFLSWILVDIAFNAVIFSCHGIFLVSTLFSVKSSYSNKENAQIISEYSLWNNLIVFKMLSTNFIYAITPQSSIGRIFEKELYLDISGNYPLHFKLI